MTLNCAIIGCGRIAPNHTLPYEKNPETTITWACDLVYQKAKKLAQELNIPNATTDLQDVLDDPSVAVISILTDHYSHFELAKQALMANKNVIVEKPFTLSAVHAQELIDLAEEKQVKLICISQHRFDPMIYKLREMVQTGGIGKILLVNARLICGRTADYYTDSYWHGLAELDGGSALINQGYHILDIITSFMGQPKILNVYADRRHHSDIIETEDTISLQFQFQDNSLGSLNITSGWEKEDWDPSIEIIGTKGKVQFDLCFPHKTPIIIGENLEIKEFEPSLDNESALGTDYYGDLHEVQINDFIDAVIHDRTVAFEPGQALKTLETIFEAYHNAQDNGFEWGHITRK